MIWSIKILPTQSGQIGMGFLTMNLELKVSFGVLVIRHLQQNVALETGKTLIFTTQFQGKSIHLYTMVKFTNIFLSHI